VAGHLRCFRGDERPRGAPRVETRETPAGEARRIARERYANPAR